MQEEFNWRDEGISIPIGAHPDYKGDVLMPCPFCSSERKPIHQKQKCFSVNINEGMYYCNHCGTKGRAKRFNEMKDTYHHSRNDAPRREKPVYQKPTDQGTVLDDNIVKYFEKRGISKSTIDFARITQGTHDMPQKDGSYKRSVCIHFNYYLNGELVNIKYRDNQKNFMLSKGSERLPYNIDNIRETEECIWVEGEFDALSFIEACRTDVVSVPNGAQPNLSYLDYYIEDYFDDKKVIYIAVDNDEPGCRLRDELIHRFGEERCRIVKFGEGCKDANDHLVKYGASSLLKCLEDAKDIPLTDVYTVKSFKDKLAEIFVEGRKPGLKLGIPNLDEYITWETKRLLVCTGIPSSGKTAFLNFIAVLFNIRHNWRIGFYSPESFPITNHIIDIIELIAGKKYSKQMMNDVERTQLENYIEENFFFTYPEDSSIDNIIAIAGRLVRRYGIRMFVIDPYNNIEYNAHNYQSKTDFVNTLLRKLSDFAKRYDVLVALMAHPTKMAKDKDGNTMIPDLYSISDSANFRNKADYGLVVHRVNEGDKYTVVKVEKVKTKELGSIGDAYFKFNMNNARYIPYTLGSTAPIAYDNHSYLDDLKHEDTQTYFDEAFFDSIANAVTLIPQDAPLPESECIAVRTIDCKNAGTPIGDKHCSHICPSADAPQPSSSSSAPYMESPTPQGLPSTFPPPPDMAFSPLPISDDELPF